MWLDCVHKGASDKKKGEMKGLLFFISVLCCAAIPDMIGWNVYDFPGDVPKTCIPWDLSRASRRHFSCPPNVFSQLQDVRLVLSDVGSLMQQERKPSLQRRQSSSLPPFFDVFRTFDEINTQLAAWAAANPSLMSLSVIGRSYEGRNITLVKVAKTSNLPIVFLNTGLQ